MVVDGYLRGKRADVLRSAVEQKLVSISELKSMLFEDRRGDPLGNYKAGLVLLTIGIVFLVWGAGEVIALKANPELMKLPGLRIGVVQPQNNAYSSLFSPEKGTDNQAEEEKRARPIEADKVTRKKSGGKAQSRLDDLRSEERPALGEIDPERLEKFIDDYRLRPESGEDREELRNRVREMILERRQQQVKDELPNGLGFGRGQLNPDQLEAEKAKQLYGQRKIIGSKKRMVILETPGLPLIALTKLFLGTMVTAISIILLLIHRKSIHEKLK